MCAKTTILASPLLKENKFWLNGKEQSFDNERLNNCLKEGEELNELFIRKPTFLYLITNNLHFLCFNNNN